MFMPLSALGVATPTDCATARAASVGYQASSDAHRAKGHTDIANAYQAASDAAYDCDLEAMNTALNLARLAELAQPTEGGAGGGQQQPAAGGMSTGEKIGIGIAIAGLIVIGVGYKMKAKGR
jgi:hypothetical protein